MVRGVVRDIALIAAALGFLHVLGYFDYKFDSIKPSHYVFKIIAH
jgi:hypothetical protein